MHTDVLTKDQRAALDALKPLAFPAAFHLAGGTALALRHGHRRSADAERQPMPEMLVAFDWAEAKRFFATEASRLLGDGIG